MYRALLVIPLFVLVSACGGGSSSSPSSSDATQSATSTSTPEPSQTSTPDPSPTVAAAQRTLINPALTGNGPAGLANTWQSALDSGVSVRTFVQEEDGVTIPRRYLMYLPQNFDPNQTYPLVIVLHGGGINAEITRQFDTEVDLEPLADRDEFIVVYGNATAITEAQANDDLFFANSGVWLRTPTNPGLTPDFLQRELDYLVEIENDLALQGVQIDPDARFVSGISNGGEMALYAADRLAPRYRAAFAGIPVPISPTNVTNPISMMIYYSVNDPVFAQFPQPYSQAMQNTYESWASVMGIDAASLNAISFTPIQNTVNEGDSYSGSAPVALNSRNSQLEDVTLVSSDGQNQLHIIRSETAGHGIPHPLQFDIGTVERSNGFRNEDVNSIELMWTFFSQFINE